MTVLWLEARTLELDAPLPDDVVSVVHVINFLADRNTLRAVVMTRRFVPDETGTGDPLDLIQVTIDQALEEE